MSPTSGIVPSVAFSGIDFTGSASDSVLSATNAFFVVNDTVDATGNASFTLGVIFDQSLLASLPASPTNEVVLANALFDIDPFAAPESFSIDLSRPVGNPPVSTSLSSFARTLLPVYQPGTILVETEFALSADSAQVTAGQDIDLFVRLENPFEITAFQIVFTYDPDELSVENLEDVFGNPLAGAVASDAYAGTDFELWINTNAIVPEFESLNLLDLPSSRRLVSLSVIPDFSPPFSQPPVPPSASQSVVKLETEPQVPNTTIDLTSTAIDPPATNLVTLGNGSDINPALVDGILYSTPADLRLQQTVVARPNSFASVPVVATSPFNITGYSLAFSFDPAEVDVDTTASPTPWMAGTSIAFDPADIEFFSTNRIPGAITSGPTPRDVVEVLCIFDTESSGVPLDPTRRIPSGPNRIVTRIPLVVGNDFGGQTSTRISLETGFLANEIYVSGTTPMPTVFAAPQVVSVDVELGGDCFVRGDTDVNGSFGIPDAIYLLSYLFTGGAEPPCFDAADVNDDEAVNLADAIGTLSFLFSGSTIPSAMPGCSPEPGCGTDPSGDVIGCEAYPVSRCP